MLNKDVPQVKSAEEISCVNSSVNIKENPQSESFSEESILEQPVPFIESRIGHATSSLFLPPNLDLSELPSHSNHVNSCIEIKAVNIGLGPREDSLVIPILVNGDEVDALLDIGAQVTILSNEFLANMRNPPQLLDPVRLKGAGIGSFMQGHIAGEINISIQDNVYKWRPYAAPVTDPVILGLDFLKHIGATIDLVKSVIYVESTEVPAHLRGTENLQVNNIKNEEDLNSKLVDKLRETLPSHVHDLFNRSCKELEPHQCEAVAKLLGSFADVFSVTDTDLGYFTEIEHTIDTGEAKPIRSRMRRTALEFQGEEEKHVNAMLNAGVIKPSSSPWSASPVLIRKRDSSLRYCIDYRRLNEVTTRDAFPLPLIEDCIDSLAGCKWFSSLDMNSGYWQIKLSEKDAPKTAFITKYGLFEWTRLPFGLSGAPATFQRAVQLVLQGLLWSKALSYLDDVVVLGPDFTSALENLAQVLQRFRDYNLKLKARKCHLFQRKIKFLGRVVSSQGIEVDPGTFSIIRDWPVPRSVREVESFLGYANYHREFVPNYANISVPLYELTGPKAVFEWTEEKQVSFENVKKALSEMSPLSFPDPNETYILDCDASDRAIGGELGQLQEGRVVPIGFASFVLTKEQRKYCTTRKELLAVLRLTRQFRHYLLGKTVWVRTDHNSLTWLLRFKQIQGQLARWIEELAEYDIVIIHRAGKLHQNADGLSRIPDHLEECNCYEAGKRVEDLPCGGCSYCKRAQEQWGRFEDDVDDVVPIAVRAVSLDREGAIICPNWLNNYSPDYISKCQNEDPELKPLIQWLNTGENPSQGELALSEPGTRHFWRVKEQLIQQNGLLYYKWEKIDEDQKFLLILPKKFVPEVLAFAHDSVTSGHLGVAKTRSKLQQSFIWYGMGRDCKDYIYSCHICRVNKKVSPKPRAALGSYHAGLPMERVHFDILGPLPVSNKGNVYVLVIIDQFTKWVESYALPDQKAESIAEKLVFEFISRFGCPLEIHTDQGRNVDGSLINSICSLLQVRKTRTTPYHPSSNGQCERYNRTILQMVRCFMTGNVKDWDVHLPILMGALRSVPNRNTGYTPNMLMFGREVWGPENLIFGVNTEPPACVDDFVTRLQERVERAHRIVRKSLRESQAVQKRTYDNKTVQHSYGVGDLVLKRDWAGKKGESPKLRPIWKGPLLVVKSLSPMLVQIQGRKRSEVVHHDNLLPYHGGNIPLWVRRFRHRLERESDSVVLQDVLEQDEPLGLSSLFGEDEGRGDHVYSQVNEPVNDFDLFPNDISTSESDTTPIDTASKPKRKPRRRPQTAPEVEEPEPDPIVTRRGREVKLPPWLKGMVQ